MTTPDYTAFEKLIGADLSTRLLSLTNEIKAASQSSHRLGTVMIVLTIVIAAAAVASTIAAFMN